MSAPFKTRKAGAQPPGRACPQCGAPVTPRYAPFCSRRCADVDLHRWLHDGYAIPGRPAEDEGEA
ncbi:MAG: DNA gyrase inhibitor YacG [Pseudomonadota bacterium]